MLESISLNGWWGSTGGASTKLAPEYMVVPQEAPGLWAMSCEEATSCKICPDTVASSFVCFFNETQY
jgi:hypothetical protein